MMADKIDGAIASSQPPEVAMSQQTVTISSSGRPFVVAYPSDLSDGELLEVLGWMAISLRASIAQRQAAAGPLARIQVARSLPPS